MMNIYIKKWPLEDVDPEFHDVLGLKFCKHASKKYHAWSLDLILLTKGMICITITSNHKKYFKANDVGIGDEITFTNDNFVPAKLSISIRLYECLYTLCSIWKKGDVEVLYIPGTNTKSWEQIIKKIDKKKK